MTLHTSGKSGNSEDTPTGNSSLHLVSRNEGHQETSIWGLGKGSEQRCTAAQASQPVMPSFTLASVPPFPTCPMDRAPLHAVKYTQNNLVQRMTLIYCLLMCISDTD